MSYAYRTKVPVDRSRAEIERIVTKYGAKEFASGWNEGNAMIGFRAHDRNVRFLLALPTTKEFRSQDALAAESRRRWRALALVIKAKLEAVSSKITTFEDEFMAHIILPDGKTVAQHVRPQIDAAYVSGRVGRLLLGTGE